MLKSLVILALCALPIFAHPANPLLKTYKITCYIHDHGNGLYFVDVRQPKSLHKFSLAILKRVTDRKRVIYPLSPYVTNVIKKDSSKCTRVNMFPRKNGEINEEKQVGR